MPLISNLHLYATMIAALVLLLSLGEAMGYCDFARNYCLTRSTRSCRVAVKVACKCNELESTGCRSFRPQDNFERQLVDFGRSCSPSGCRLAINWCPWTSWNTYFRNSSCEGEYYYQTRRRQRCCVPYRRRISYLCAGGSRRVRVESGNRRRFEASVQGCDGGGGGGGGVSWLKELGYGIAASVGFASLIKCARMCCGKKQQAAEEPTPLSPVENFENSRLEVQDDPSAFPESVPLDPCAPPPSTGLPPSYEEVTRCPDNFELPPDQKRF